MEAITTDEEYKLIMRKIHMLMSLGSQRISNEQMSELTELSRQASAYEKVRYDYIRQSSANLQADSSVK